MCALLFLVVEYEWYLVHMCGCVCGQSSCSGFILLNHNGICDICAGVCVASVFLLAGGCWMIMALGTSEQGCGQITCTYWREIDEE